MTVSCLHTDNLILKTENPTGKLHWNRGCPYPQTANLDSSRRQ